MTTRWTRAAWLVLCSSAAVAVLVAFAQADPPPPGVALRDPEATAPVAPGAAPAVSSGPAAPAARAESLHRVEVVLPPPPPRELVDGAGARAAVHVYAIVDLVPATGTARASRRAVQQLAMGLKLATDPGYWQRGDAGLEALDDGRLRVVGSVQMQQRVQALLHDLRQSPPVVR